jgi:hypothetical protein
MNVELEVMKPVVPPAPYKNKYVVQMNFMHGDGDFNESETAVYEDSEIVKKLLEVLKNCQKLYPSGKGGYSLTCMMMNWLLKITKNSIV